MPSIVSNSGTIKTLVLDNHQIVVDRDYLDELKTSHERCRTFVKWCLSDKFDSRDIGARAAYALGV